MLLKHYLQTGWRNLVKHKAISCINIFGLAVGLAAVILIALFVHHELSFDKHWAKADRIYRVHSTLHPPGRAPLVLPLTSNLAKIALEQEYPQIKTIARVQSRTLSISRGDESWPQDIAAVDPAFFDIFDWEVLAGNLSATIEDRQSLVLTELLAEKYFGEEDPIGQTLRITDQDGIDEVKVGAVIKNPDHSHLQIFAARRIDDSVTSQFWAATSVNTYFLLDAAADIETVATSIKSLPDQYFPGPYPNAVFDKTSDFVELSVMNVEKLHGLAFSMDGISWGPKPVNPSMLIGFSAAAVLILLIACINCMNLNTARASQRAREISLRKTAGAKRPQLVFQFLGESVLTTLISVVIALALIELCLPAYNNLLGKSLSLTYSNLELFGLLGLTLAIGFASGFYPALVLSGFRPATALRANSSARSKGALRFQSVLVVFQFTVVVTLLTVTAVIYAQIRHLNDQDLGFNTDSVLVLRGLNQAQAVDKQEALITALRRHRQVVSATRTNYDLFSAQLISTRTPSTQDGPPSTITRYKVDYDFFATYQIPLVAGRAFMDKSKGSDSIDRRSIESDPFDLNAYQSATSDALGILINETAARQLDIAIDESALGSRILLAEKNGQVAYELIGIVADFHLQGPGTRVQPLQFTLGDMQAVAGSAESFNSIHLRYQGEVKTLLEDIAALQQQITPGHSAHVVELDSFFAGKQQNENHQAQMFSIFALLTITIACLGLYALARFATALRTKEIGIRKALGAKLGDILKLMLWQFSKPVMLANLIAWPVAFYLMSRWLQNFSYQIGSGQLILFGLLSGVLALLIAWGTVASNAFRAARARPVKALRYE